ncbi:NlpC/P60 family protein [Pontibacter silvestris]|uniref:NlpC/P60 family protein n=1 Tax=Pontibacter silvestris TaxID=2305183 RepID=A0ABW4WTK7_9BACT|nr:NlpC/P60 family protein [Pontibacter silvestris]MCC9137797.1 NlpC/P60 family protein [Pontibacter silvestris]
MKTSPLILLLGFLMACVSSPSNIASTSSASSIQASVDAIRKEYAPDKRTALFQVKVKDNVLRGETNLPGAKAALLQRLQAENISYQDSIVVLPEKELNGNNHAIVTVSVANLRSQPKHSAELATQATMGMALNVWKKENGWYLVQTPDDYLAWVDAGGIKLVNDTELAQWQQSEKLLYTNPYGFSYAGPNAEGATVSDLVYGDVVAIQSQAKKGFYEVRYPDGRLAYVPGSAAVKYKEWVRTRQPSEENLVSTSRRLLGLPYLWGGTSFKGVDCSGFTKTVYFMNGLVLPRDASQQVHLGELVDTKSGWGNLRPGDLLFFGVPAHDGKPERVVHVGMWIGGNQEFIHSSGKVRISSMNPAASNFDENELNRFLRAKRIPPQSTLMDLRTASLYE